MIGIVDVEVQAANPQMPLCPFVAFVGSPSSVRVRNVPGNIGSWNITKVYVSANYPDNSIQSRECTRVGEIYVGTLPACNAVGKGANGFVVSADGVDENGNAVTGYVLGKGDLEILDADGAITPGVTTHYVHGLDEQPSDPHEYDIYKAGDTWKIYFDGAWEPFAAPVTFDNAVTKDSANGVKSSGIWSAIWGTASTAFSSLYDWCVAQLAGKVPTSRKVNGKALSADVTLTGADIPVSGADATKINAALADKATKADATLTPIYGDIWVISPSVGPHGEPLEITYGIYWSPTTWALNENIYSGQSWKAIGNPPADAISLTFDMDGTTVVATRQTAEHVVVGYRLGPDSATNPNRDKPLASEAEAEALRADKANRAANPTAGNLAALDAQGNPTDAGWTAVDLARYALTTKTINNGAVTLDDRAINAVAVSSSLASLTVNFPTATSGKARDFGLRLTVASGITTAPELALPQGVTCENADGEAPEIGADGAATILYFTETASGAFLVKGDVLQTITQA